MIVSYCSNYKTYFLILIEAMIKARSVASMHITWKNLS